MPSGLAVTFALSINSSLTASNTKDHIGKDKTHGTCTEASGNLTKCKSFCYNESIGINNALMH